MCIINYNDDDNDGDDDDDDEEEAEDDDDKWGQTLLFLHAGWKSSILQLTPFRWHFWPNMDCLPLHSRVIQKQAFQFCN